MIAQFRLWTAAGLFVALCLGTTTACLADDGKSADGEKPMKMAGTWRWKWTDAKGVIHHHVLEVEGEGKTLSARERFDDEKPVKINDMKVEGKTVTFSVTRGDHHAAYKGKFKSDDHIDGTVDVNERQEVSEEYGWSADREEADDKASPKSKPD